MNNSTLKTICYGEVLWDAFPAYKKIGGAPLNVCIRLASFGVNSSIISSVGNDDSGSELLKNIQKNYPGINISNIQKNDKYPTSEVKVFLDKNGVANYDIKNDVAWDNILFNSILEEKTANADIFIFGSLISRENVSRNTLLKLLKVANFKVFDVNLRPPHYSINLLTSFMQHADFIKFNDDEIFEVTTALNFKSEELEEQIRFIANTTGTEIICVTKGAHGAVLFYKNKFYYNEGYEVTVIDTVGSGDSFLAAIVYKIKQKKSPKQALDFACAIGAIVATHEGANPIINLAEINELTTMNM